MYNRPADLVFIKKSGKQRSVTPKKDDDNKIYGIVFSQTKSS